MMNEQQDALTESGIFVKSLQNPSLCPAGILPDGRPVYFKCKEAYHKALSVSLSLQGDIAILDTTVSLMAQFNPESKRLPEIVSQADGLMATLNDIRSKLIDCFYYELEKKWRSPNPDDAL